MLWFTFSTWLPQLAFGKCSSSCWMLQLFCSKNFSNVETLSHNPSGLRLTASRKIIHCFRFICFPFKSSHQWRYAILLYLSACWLKCLNLIISAFQAVSNHCRNNFCCNRFDYIKTQIEAFTLDSGFYFIPYAIITDFV